MPPRPRVSETRSFCGCGSGPQSPPGRPTGKWALAGQCPAMAGGILPETIIVIGDTMETDIRGAVEAGLQAYLVLSGATNLKVVADYVYQPTRVLNSVADLIEELKSGTPSDPPRQPCPRETAPNCGARFWGCRRSWRSSKGRHNLKLPAGFKRQVRSFCPDLIIHQQLKNNVVSG